MSMGKWSSLGKESVVAVKLRCKSFVSLRRASKVSESEEGSHGDDVTPPLSKLLPLNSWRLTTAYMKHIAQSLELPIAGSADEVRQLIEEKLQET